MEKIPTLWYTLLLPQSPAFPMKTVFGTGARLALGDARAVASARGRAIGKASASSLQSKTKRTQENTFYQ
jgi:hypothetical protein